MKGSGIEIGSHALRLIEVERARRNETIMNWGAVAVPPGVIEGGAIVDPNTAVPLLHGLVAQSHKRKLHGPVRVSLPEQSTFVKVIHVPLVEGRELPDAVKFEAGQHIPFAPDEVVLDWHELSHDKTGSSVLLGAAPHAVVDATLAAFDAAQIPVERLEIESLALARAVLRSTAPAAAPRILVDLGDSRTQLVMYDQGTVLFTSTLSFSQAALTRQLTADLGISEADAEKAKRLFGLDAKRGRGIVRKTILPMLAELVDGIMKTTRFYAENAGGRAVEVALLTGGGSLLPGLAAALAHELKLRVRLAELPPALKPLGPSFATAFGLALAPTE